MLVKQKISPGAGHGLSPLSPHYSDSSSPDIQEATRVEEQTDHSSQRGSKRSGSSREAAAVQAEEKDHAATHRSCVCAGSLWTGSAFPRVDPCSSWSTAAGER